MALRDQPYLPLYIQDFMTDEKLIECSANATGVYIRLMCMLHKTETYGVIELKAKYKQIESKTRAFSEMLYKQMPFTLEEIETGLTELIAEGVCQLSGDFLSQKRMKNDGEISTKRAESGSLGGKIGRNSSVRRYYNEHGFLYLIYDEKDKRAFKIGISKEPESRLVGIRKKTGRKKLVFRKKWRVNDMGEVEQSVLDFFEEIRDGEWIYGDYKVEDIEKKIEDIVQKTLLSKTEGKQNQNTEIESEYESNVFTVFPLTLNSVLPEYFNNCLTFEEFWNLYDKKTDREKCFKKFTKLKKSDIELIKQKLPIYINKTPNPQYRKNPLTWINGKCWNDEDLLNTKISQNGHTTESIFREQD